VSTTTNRRPFPSASPYIRSLVVRARSSTIACRLPTIRLKSVLFPTFGRPTMATTGNPAWAWARATGLSSARRRGGALVVHERRQRRGAARRRRGTGQRLLGELGGDRNSTRLNSSPERKSYAV